MSDDYLDADDDEGDNPDESSVIRKLRKQARENSDAAKRAEAAERKLAFLEAGIRNDAKTAYFIRGYEGELTPEAIKEAAIAAGYLVAEDEVADPELESEAAATGRLAEAQSGSNDSAPPGYDDEIAAAKTPEEVLAIVQKHGGKVL